jgi:hypothetical protein
MRTKMITMALTLTGTVLAGGALAMAPAGAATAHPACWDCSWGDPVPVGQG